MVHSTEYGNAVAYTAQEKVADRIHVLFLIDELCRKGGAEWALFNTILWLPKRHFRCTVVTFRVDPSLPLVANFPCPVMVLPLRRTYDWNAVKAASKLMALIKDEKVDIVHTFFVSSDLWGGLVAKFSRRPFLVSSRRDMGILRTPKHRLAYRTLHSMFDRVVAVSEAVREHAIVQDRLDPARVTTIYNAIDLKRTQLPVDRAKILGRYAIPEHSKVVVSVGNIRKLKGFDVLIRAAALVCRNTADAVFLIVGGTDPAEPHYTRELAELSDSQGISDKIKFAGALDDVIPLLRSSDAFCLLSRSEGFSNALLEAMACGLPSVCTRVGGNGEVVQHGHSGYLVESGDSSSAAEFLSNVLHDPRLAVRMGANARSTISERFSSESATSQLVNLYQSLIEGRSTRA
jgi:glycosyltransferase involved in cell wall biosynthesis